MLHTCCICVAYQQNPMQLTTFHNFYKPCILGLLQQNPAINDFSKKCKIYLYMNCFDPQSKTNKKEPRIHSKDSKFLFSFYSTGSWLRRYKVRISSAYLSFSSGHLSKSANSSAYFVPIYSFGP